MQARNVVNCGKVNRGGEGAQERPNVQEQPAMRWKGSEKREVVERVVSRAVRKR